MFRSSRLSTWLPRVVLALVTFLFGMIFWRFMSDPTGMAPDFGLATTSSLGATTLRVSMGVFPVTLGLITAYCLITARFAAGLTIVAFIMGLILCVRLYAGLTGAIMAEHTFVIYAEAVFLTLSLIGLFLLNARQRQHT